jgi:cyclase
MGGGKRMIDPSSKSALPVVTYHEGLTLHLNGDEVRARHMHDAHTDGDSIIIWKAANVIHMGDLFFNKVTLPFIDLNSGGSAKGMLDAIEKTLPLTNAATKIIPGHGPVASQGDLMAYRDMLKAVIGSVEAGIKAKKSLAQIQAIKPAAKWEVAGAFISGDAFVAAVYKSLTAPAKTKAHQH